MRSSLLSRRVAAALLALALPATSAVLAAQGEEGEEEEGPPPNGAVTIPYQETAEIRPGEGWLIDCSRPAAIEGAALTCAPDVITLSAEYEPEWGEHLLAVHLVSRHTDLEVGYRIRMEPPPAPEIAVERLDMPIAVGAQAMVPLSALGISCEACSDAGGATIEVGELPPGVSVGVSETHLSVRGSATGDVEIPLRVTDDAGQEAATDLTLSIVPADEERSGEQSPGAMHIVTPAAEWDLTGFAWGEDVTILCTEPRPAALGCAPDGTAEFSVAQSGDGQPSVAELVKPAQFMYRVIAPDGDQAWGSVTFDESVEEDAPAVPVWKHKAPLHMVFPPSGDDTHVEGESLLGPLTLLLEGIPGS